MLKVQTKIKRRKAMRLRSLSILAAGTMVALSLMPGRARADLLLDTGTLTMGNSSRDPGDIGFGQGVFVTTTTELTQMAMFLEVPNGGTLKYLIWDGSNTNLLASDIVSVSPSTAPEWILSDPLSLTLNSGSTYYFGAIQDDKTKIVAPFFLQSTSMAQNGLTTLTSGNSNYADFITPIFTTFGSGASFPLQLFGTQETGGTPVPEPSVLMFLACGSIAIAWRRRPAVSPR
jgi:hypothetical protein